MTIQISDAKPEDAEGMTRVYYESWLDTYPNEEVGITRDDIEDQFKDHLSEDRIRQAKVRLSKPVENLKRLNVKVDDLVVGVCVLVKHEDRNQLKAIYVLPEYQRKGIGKMFWQEAQKFFDPKNETFVHVATYNQKAINFYKKLGFVETGKHFTEERHRMKSGVIMPETELVLRAREK